MSPEPLRPRDLALLLLASRDLRPRQRARDQQADAAGLALKRRVLDRVAALDPEPAEFEAALVELWCKVPTWFPGQFYPNYTPPVSEACQAKLQELGIQ